MAATAGEPCATPGWNRRAPSPSGTRDPARAGHDAAHRWLAGVLADVGLLGPGRGNGARSATLDPRSVQVLRARRWYLVAGDLVDLDGGRRPVVAKQYRDDRGARTLALLRLLGEDGLGAGPCRVTAGLGWCAAQRALVTERAPGQAWSDLLGGDEALLRRASAAVGTWLLTLREVPDRHRLPDRTGHRAEADLAREAEALAWRHPAYRRRLAALSGRALMRLSDGPAPDLVSSHGDLHPHNVHVRQERGDLGELGDTADGPGVRVTALDLDTAGLRRPSYDVGYAVAQLLVMSAIRCHSFVPGAVAAEAFWAVVGAAPDGHAVSAQVTRALVQSLHYELVTLDNGRVDLLPRWCGVAERALDEGVPALLRDLRLGWTP